MIGLNKMVCDASLKRAYATDPTGVAIHGSELNKSAFPMSSFCFVSFRVSFRSLCFVSFRFVSLFRFYVMMNNNATQ